MSLNNCIEVTKIKRSGLYGKGVWKWIDPNTTEEKTRRGTRINVKKFLIDTYPYKCIKMEY